MIKLGVWGLPLVWAVSCLFTRICAGDESERQQIQLTDSTWGSLTQEQRDLVGTQYIVSVEASSNFARIVYVQGLDESTSGTTVGAATGSALAQAHYIDKSNIAHYSATKQVGAGLVGALLGSLLDAPARQQYRHVYTLKDFKGTVSTLEKVTDTAIFVAPNICVNTETFAAVNDNLCDNVLPAEIARLVSSSGFQQDGVTGSRKVATSPTTAPINVAEKVIPAAENAPDIPVMCRFGNTANVQTTSMKCKQAGGIQKQ